MFDTCLSNGFVLWHSSLGTSWLNISSSVRTVDQIFIFLLLIDIVERRQGARERERVRLPLGQTKKTLHRTSLISFVRCLQITSLAIDLHIFSLKRRSFSAGNDDVLLGVDDLLANQQRTRYFSISVVYFLSPSLDMFICVLTSSSTRN